MARIIIALYNELDDARRAVEALQENGFPREDISLVASDPRGDYGKYLRADGRRDPENVAGGAVSGALIGGLGGLLVGLAAVAIPGIGAVIAAGPLVSALAGAGVGAAAGGLVGALINLGVPAPDAGYYTEGVRRGGFLVTAEAPDERAARAVEILNRFNPVDVDRMAEDWRSQEAEPANQGLDPSVYQPTNLETESGFPAAAQPQESDPSEFEPAFHQHFQTSLSQRGRTYSEVYPAYSYGVTLAKDPRYQGLDWEQVEAHARQEWQRSHTGTPWEDFRDAARAGWSVVTNR